MNPYKNSSLMFLLGFGIGAGLMYLLDPERGRARRALIRTSTVGALKEVENQATEAAGEVTRRARGLVAEARRAL